MKKEKKALSKKDAPKDPQKKKWIISLTVLIIGIILVIAGIIALIINASQGSVAKDAEYLVAADSWVLEDSDRVEWDFTEIGKGTLTTNNHENDYNFKWVIEDGKLKIETDWLYELDNEFDYSLDQNSGTLTLTSDGNSYKFVTKQ